MYAQRSHPPGQGVRTQASAFGSRFLFSKHVRCQTHRSSIKLTCKITGSSNEVTLLDYGAGNIRSIKNAIKKLGYSINEVTTPQDILNADRLIFPGVLFEGSEEDGGSEGLSVVPGMVSRFQTMRGFPVPHIGWNELHQVRKSRLLRTVGDKRVYFVHSYRAVPTDENQDWVLATCDYGCEFIAAIQKGNIYATQFHPEKSGSVGLDILESFLSPDGSDASIMSVTETEISGLAKRVIACLDVRSNDNGDLVVTKGDQYDVRETGDNDSSGNVRNLGKPVELAERYFEEGADEITFLNITGFRDFPLGDLPMLDVLKATSEKVFVPLTVGGGIRAFTDADGRTYSALEVASEYFRSGADKVSIGGDAVFAAEKYIRNGNQKKGDSCIEEISRVYGAQAVVISIDPKRVYVNRPEDTAHHTVETAKKGPNGETYCWWQCTVKGGREGRDIDAVQLATISENLGAGEILLNCIDNDGAGQGFDVELVKAVSDAVSIPVIASSGAGAPSHFTQIFQETGASAGLAAGIFHRKEVSINDVKSHMIQHGIPARKC
eukprot:jgi/Picsp_1/6537/NSC_03880-R1_glutamine amidotransferase cyclase